MAGSESTTWSEVRTQTSSSYYYYFYDWASIDDYTEWKVAYAMWKYVPPFLILGGVTGNMISLAVMMKSFQQGSSKSLTVFLLSVLAIADTLVLLTSLIRQWMNTLVDFDIRRYSSLGCKTHIFLVYLLGQFANWVLTLVSLERFLSVQLPFGFRRHLTPTRGAFALLIIASFLICINSHFFVTFDLQSYTDRLTNQTSYYCRAVTKHSGFILFVWPYIDFIVFCGIPFLSITASSGCIILRLYYRRPSSMTGASQQLTFSLLMVSFYFLLAVIPIEVYFFIQYRWTESKDPYSVAQGHLFYAVGNLLLYSNNCANFFLYCLSGPRFRRQLKTMMCNNTVEPIRGTSQNSGSNNIRKRHGSTTIELLRQKKHSSAPNASSDIGATHSQKVQINHM